MGRPCAFITRYACSAVGLNLFLPVGVTSHIFQDCVHASPEPTKHLQLPPTGRDRFPEDANASLNKARYLTGCSGQFWSGIECIYERGKAADSETVRLFMRFSVKF